MAIEDSERPLEPFRWPWATFALVAALLYSFYLEDRAMRWGIFSDMIQDFAFYWSRFRENPLIESPRLISHLFVHGNWSHVIGNTIFFTIFAPDVEQRTGALSFFGLFFIWGAVAALTESFFWPTALPSIGSSGAISGAAGAYFVLFPLMRSWRRIPAFLFVGAWFFSQLKGGFLSLMPAPYQSEISLIAHWAHVGGFAVGALSMLPFLFVSLPKKIAG